MSISFCDLLEVHTRLDDLFLEHQRALLRLDLVAAFAALEAYELELSAHMMDEEQLMLPLYRERVEAPIGGAAEIFFGEHNKLRQYVELFNEALAKLKKTDDLEKGVIWLLDSQNTFKRLHVHHDTREKKMLYPLLDKVTTDEERRRVLATMQLPPANFKIRSARNA
jgi:hemerythrin-like domain-containing protein